MGIVTVTADADPLGRLTDALGQHYNFRPRRLARSTGLRSS